MLHRLLGFNGKKRYCIDKQNYKKIKRFIIISYRRYNNSNINNYNSLKRHC